MRCHQCNEILKGYYQFYTCSACYTKNVTTRHKEYLNSKESNNEYKLVLLHKSKTSPSY